MLSRLYGVLLPFFVSFLLAWLLDPLVTFIQHKCKVKFRGLSVAITLTTIILSCYRHYVLHEPFTSRQKETNSRK